MTLYYNPILKVFQTKSITPYLKKDFKGWHFTPNNDIIN